MVKKREQVNITCIDETLLEKAFKDVRKSRLHHCSNASIWDVSLHWSEIKQRLLKNIHLGHYQLSPCVSYFKDGEWRSYWDAQDAVVLKALYYLLQEKMNIPNCHHLKGHGGIHGSIKALHQAKPHYQKVFKSDIDSYYASINHQILLNQLKSYSQCPIIMDLFKQYMKRVEIKNGNYYSFEQGIPKGCSLSPLMSAIYLAPLDNQLKTFGFYRRYMDDWIVLVKTRAQLRKVIKITHHVLKSLKLRMHPKKTFIGCIDKGFAFLGIQWNKNPEIAKQSTEKHQVKLALRYAQNASLKSIGDYLRRWNLWCCSILKCCMDELHNNKNLPCNANQGEHHDKYKEAGNSIIAI